MASGMAGSVVFTGSTDLDLSDYGGFLRRFAAVFVDGLLMIVAMVVVGFVIALVFQGAMPNPKNVAQVGAMIGSFLLLYLFLLLVPVAYEIVMIGDRGATLGKKMGKLVVVRTNGDPVSMGRSVLRYLAKLFLSSIFLIGYVMALFTARRQALHDLIADTIVVRADG
jgi:uncharacterized RDD family membrane protein YckC